MRRSHIAAFAALSLIGALAACEVRAADAAPPPHDAVVVPAACAADSLCYVVSWPAASDGNGTADAYHVRVSTASAVVLDQTLAALSVRLAVARPAPGQSVTLTAQVWSVRRGLQSATPASATITSTTPDVAPPPPASVTITPDTVPDLSMSRIEGPDSIPRDSVVSYALVSPSGFDGVQYIAWWVEPGGGQVFATPKYLDERGEIGQHGEVAAYLSPGDSLQLVLGPLASRGGWLPWISRTIYVR